MAVSRRTDAWGQGGSKSFCHSSSVISKALTVYSPAVNLPRKLLSSTAASTLLNRHVQPSAPRTRLTSQIHRGLSCSGARQGPSQLPARGGSHRHGRTLRWHQVVPFLKPSFSPLPQTRAGLSRCLHQTTQPRGMQPALPGAGSAPRESAASLHGSRAPAPPSTRIGAKSQLEAKAQVPASKFCGEKAQIEGTPRSLEEPRV